jgi:endoglucanase
VCYPWVRRAQALPTQTHPTPSRRPLGRPVQPYFAATNFPANTSSVWEQQFGSLISAGHTIVIGEFDGRYCHGDSAKDKVWQDALVDYLVAKRANRAFWS